MQSMQNLQSSNWMFVAAAYAAAWIVILGYAVYSYRTLSRARQALWHATGPTWRGTPQR